MNKYVYLFELDSVRKTDEEIIEGQRALYDEIVTNGNVVVMTYNQLVDSRGFFSLIDIQEYYENLIQLFERGALRISQFGNLRTIVHYILNSIDNDDNKFIYSALPLKYSQRRLCALVKRSLLYSDLSEIYRYYKFQSEEKVRELFVEVNDGIIHESEDSIENLRNTLENLYWFLSVVLRLSTMHDIYIPPRDRSEYSGQDFKRILKLVLTFKSEENSELWNSSVAVINSLSCFGNNSRSVYLRELRDLSLKTSDISLIDSYRYSEAIINLCYNYASEISICNTSKHYDYDELIKDSGTYPTFEADFFLRLKQLWKDGKDSDMKFLQEETNDFLEFVQVDKIPDFSKAVRVVDYLKSDYAVKSDEVYRYEYGIDNQRKSLNKSIARNLFSRLGSLLICMLIIMILALMEEVGQNLVAQDFSFIESTKAVIGFTLQAFIFLCLGEFVSDLISKKFPWFLSLSEVVNSFIEIISDAFSMIFKKSKPYSNDFKADEKSSEKRNSEKPIDLYESKEIIRYRKWLSSGKANGSNLVLESDVYPIANVNDPEVIRELMRIEELYNVKFGIPYKSKYNTFVVDPVAGSKNGYFTYDRVVPSSEKAGVVTVAMHDGKFVLLNQYRHSIREEQYSFPRGFSEKEGTLEDNAVRELSEEINAVITKKPDFLGMVSPDSGLTSTKAAVFLVEVDSFKTNEGHEGILNSVLLTPDEMSEWIKEGKIDDGFTLSSYALYQAFKGRK